MSAKPRKYLYFRHAYWSCSPDAYDGIMAEFDEHETVTIEGLDVFELKRKPKGDVTHFRQYTRTSE